MKEIEGYEGFYSVTEDGRVFTHRQNKFLKFGDSRGHFNVPLTMDGTQKRINVHRLVAAAFIPNPLGKPQVKHIDGNKKNNNASNLEWCTGKENVRHSIKLGFSKPFLSFRWNTRKLSDDQVRDIRHRYENNESVTEISRDYNIDFSAIYRCCRLITYKSVV